MEGRDPFVRYIWYHECRCPGDTKMDTWFHPARYWICDHLSTLGLNLIHVNARVAWRTYLTSKRWSPACGNLLQTNRHVGLDRISVHFNMITRCNNSPNLPTSNLWQHYNSCSYYTHRRVYQSASPCLVFALIDKCSGASLIWCWWNPLSM